MEVSPNPAHVLCGAEAGPLGDLLYAEVDVFDQVIRHRDPPAVDGASDRHASVRQEQPRQVARAGGSLQRRPDPCTTAAGVCCAFCRPSGPGLRAVVRPCPRVSDQATRSVSFAITASATRGKSIRASLEAGSLASFAVSANSAATNSIAITT